MSDLHAMFSCKLCGITERKVKVRERFANEDIEDYIHVVGEAVRKEHQILAPVCFAGKADIYLPMMQNGIGFAGPELTEADKAELKEQLKR